MIMIFANMYILLLWHVVIIVPELYSTFVMPTEGQSTQPYVCYYMTPLNGY